VQFVEAVLALAQWAKQNAVIRLSAQRFHIGAPRDMKFAHHLL
jgi:hypothetical protein